MTVFEIAVGFFAVIGFLCVAFVGAVVVAAILNGMSE